MTADLEVVPEQLAVDLRKAYDALPGRSAKWLTQESFDLIREMKSASRRFGYVAVARAVGLPPSTVWDIIHRSVRRKSWPYPTEEQMADVREAWAEVQKRRARRQHVRRNTIAFINMRKALQPLTEITDVSIIAVALGVEARDLKPFLAQPAAVAPPRRARPRS